MADPGPPAPPATDATDAALAAAAADLHAVREAVSRTIVGQDALISRLLIALLCDGHCLLEGVPGLAKSLSVSTLAATLHTSFVRVQFTPDLLPADLTGTEIYNARTAEFETRTGPIFANIVLADEINRAPAKVQAALLEAMEERQVSIGGKTFPLPQPFMVLATRNPIEQEGTYPLPEAQLDRFMLKNRHRLPARGRRTGDPRSPPGRRDSAHAGGDQHGHPAPRTRRTAAHPAGIPHPRLRGAADPGHTPAGPHRP